MCFEIELYENENGKKPFDEFINDLDEKHRAKVLKNLKLLQMKGNMLGMPFSKPLRDGIFELRTQYHDGISRVCYFFVYNKKIILTHGFIKKTEKTPNSEINKAIKYMNDYLARNGGK